MFKKILLKSDMCIENRRLREIQRGVKYYTNLLDQSEKISDCLIYQGKLESLKREEKQIREKYKRRSK